MLRLTARPTLTAPDTIAVQLAGAPIWVKATPRLNANCGYGEGCMSLLTREQDRRFRAAAWRHVRRINPKVARRIWCARRQRLRVMLGEAA